MSRSSRRSFLLGMGGGLATMAFARRLLSEQPVPAPKRLVLVMQNNGTQQKAFWPTQGFSSPILEPLLGDPALAKKTTVIKGIQVPRDSNGTNANEHDIGFARMFTGARLLNVGNQPWGGGPSVDQIVARAWGVDSLTFAVLASSVEPHPKPGFDHRRSFSYMRAGTHKLPTLDPFVAYTRLFADGTGVPDEEARKRLLLRKSALDAVNGNLRDVQRRLGAREREKLDVHLESVREMELGIGRLIEGRVSPGATCSRKPPKPRDFRSTEPKFLIDDEGAIPELIGSMTDILTAAIGCGVTRVATLQLGFGGGKWKFGWEGIGVDIHEQVAHKDTSDEGADPNVTARLVKANRFYASRVAGLAKALDSMPEGDGTVLDHTLVVWANEFGRGDHDMDNVPVVLIGGGAHRGGHLVDEGIQPFQRVGCTILQAMGMNAPGFGDAPTCGALRGI